jgi:tetraacyldisaccharide 4'-kinase
MISREERDAIRREARQYNATAVWAETAVGARRLIAQGGHEAPVSSLLGQPVAAFCGIGNPRGFRHLLSALGYNVAAFREFPDHHGYSPGDIQSLGEWALANRSAALVCTHKDLVKLPCERVGDCPLWAVEIGLKYLSGESELVARLQPIVSQATVSRSK